MNFAFSREEEAFRAEVVELLQDFRDVDGFYHQGQQWERVKALFLAFGERGWLSLAWPRDVGGLGKPPTYEYILWDEVAYARAARPPLGAGIVAKTIIRYGSEDQKARWLPQIRSGESHFSLGYSEPEAGSDLASLRTRAKQSGDVYQVDGEKCWQSYAQDMDYLWLLCRTGSQESRGAGLTLLIVDIDTPGLNISALPTLDDEQLNAINLDAVRVPAENRVGPEDGAWKMMAEALADERHVQFPPKRLRRDLEEVIAYVREASLERDPIVRRTLSDLAVGVYEAEMHALRVLEAVLKGRPAAAEAAASKLMQSVLCQQIARAALDFGDPGAVVSGNKVEFLWRQSMWETIGGGTSEIMRSVISRQSLGLTGTV